MSEKPFVRATAFVARWYARVPTSLGYETKGEKMPTTLWFPPAAMSFAIDQTVDLSIPAGGGHSELSGPAELLRSLIDTAYSSFSRAE